jgi:hypothetical protein
MAWFNEETPERLNFMIVGSPYAGCNWLQEALAAHPRIVCHGDILSPDESARKSSHEKYFGISGKTPDWFADGTISAEQYLNNKIFDNALHNENAIGVKAAYGHLKRFDLWDYVENRCRQGDFCLVHVVRNPIACFVAYKQQSNRLAELGVASHDLAVETTPRELADFVRDQLADEIKVNRLSADRAVIPYHELILDFRSAVTHVFGYLNTEFHSVCLANRQRVRQLDARSLIVDLDQIVKKLPPDIVDQLKQPALF